MFDIYEVKKEIEILYMHSFFETKRDANYSFKGENHDFWECVYVKKGSISVAGDERIYHLDSNDIIFHKPMEFHKYNVEDKNGAELIIFSFTAKGDLLKFFERKCFVLSHMSKQIFDNMMEYTYSYSKESEHCNNNFHELFNENTHFLQIISNYVIQLLLSLHGTGICVTSATDSHYEEVFKKAVVFMLKNISENLKIIDISNYCCISETGLKNIFNKFAGVGVHKYFIKQKINIATDLMKKGASVTEVADKLGFCNQCYFSIVYKRETGVSPGKIKNKLY